jgi:hypothetical protein
METTKNKLPEDVETFLSNLKNYINKPLFFFGSIQRIDYVKGCDIDIAIFTDNESSTNEKISHFFNHSKTKIYKYINARDKIMYCYKCYYNKLSVPLEFVIYNIKDKDDVLKRYNLFTFMPNYILILLLIVKVLYYKLHILNNSTYKYLKDTIMFTFFNKPVGTFIKL